MKNVICTICMRGGSKGVPNKNLRLMHGKPLMAYSIEQAFGCGIFEHVIVSTDSKEIADIAKSFGAEAWFFRPSDLATDKSAKIPVIRHAFLESEKYFSKNFDIIVDLDATSPLRKEEDIINAYNQFIKDDSDILITASASRKNPYFNMIEVKEGKVKVVKQLKDIIYRRQDSPQVFDMNASIYIWKRKSLLNNDTVFNDGTSLYIMPEERSVDIDTELDWKFVEFMLDNSHNKHG